MRCLPLAYALLVCSTLAYVDYGLVELDDLEKSEGLQPFLDSNLEPFGAVVVAYVDADGPNHKFMQKLAESKVKNTTSAEQAFNNLQLPMAGVTWGEKGDERLTIVYRSPFRKLWEMSNMTPMDENPEIFPTKPGATWKVKDVKTWMFKYGYPTINIRIMDKQFGDFPEARYYGWASDVGSVLIFANLSGDKEFKTQFQVSRTLRPWAEKYRGKLRFSFVDRTKPTAKFREGLSMGVDATIDTELMLMEDVVPRHTDDGHTKNHDHGNPKKYRLRDFSEEAVNHFFEDYEKKALPTYWITKEPWAWGGAKKPKGEAERLTGPSFDSWVYSESPKRARLVCFFNDDPADGCVTCEKNRPIWEKVAKQVKTTKRLEKWFDIASIDQSKNEHSESRCPGRLGNNLVFFYPPGSPATRKRKSRQLTELSTSFSVEKIIEGLDDLIAELEDDEGEL